LINWTGEMKRRIVFWILIIAFVWLVVTRFSDIRNLMSILVRGSPVWILAAVASQFLYYVVFSSLWRSSLDVVEIYLPLREAIQIVVASVFVNTVAPSGGMAGAALFADDVSKRGYSLARASAGILLVPIIDFTAFEMTLLFGLFYLFRQHALQLYQVFGAAILIAVTIVFTSVLFTGLWRPALLHRLMWYFQSFVNRAAGLVFRLLKKKNSAQLLAPGWAEKHATEFVEAAAAMKLHPRRLWRTIGIGIACHVVDLVTISMLFLAYHQPFSFGELVAGYGVGILFWIVSITPMGIGVVEGVMALTWASLGIRPEVATVVALAFRGLTFWLPLLIGFFLLQRLRSFRSTERVRSNVWSVRIVAILTGLMGIVNVFSGATQALRGRMLILEQWLPLEVRQGSHLTSVLAGFALLLLAGSLWRRKRIAWVITVGVLGISAVSHLLKGLDYEESILAMALLVWLLFLRNHFHARSDPPSIQQGFRVLALAAGFTMAYGVTGFYFLERHFSQKFGLLAAVRQTLVMFTQFYDPGLVPVTRFGSYFASSIYIVGAITIGYALLMLVRPVLVRWPATPDEMARARAIVENYGRSSIAHYTLLSDKSYFFSQGGSVIAYVVKNGVALVLGDPIGPAEDICPALVAFKKACAENDWVPALYQTLSDYLDEYRKTGFQAITIGQEGIVDLAEFTLEGRANKDMRYAYNRMLKLGYTTRIVMPPLPQELVSELHEISDEWLTNVHGSEKRFSVGWFDDEYICNSPVMVVKSPDEILSAFANILPEYRRSETAIDMMRYRPESEYGTMDFMFVSLLLWAREQGFTTFNLGLSALSGIGGSAEDPTIEKALNYIYEHVNQFYNFKGLHHFKEKFHPAWSPRYLVYQGRANLPLVALAMIQADSGDSAGFIYLKELLKKVLPTRLVKVKNEYRENLEVHAQEGVGKEDPQGESRQHQKTN
jgi:phosphatidylglycerol lysyltransferase